jgi:hypothetical protein
MGENSTNLVTLLHVDTIVSLTTTVTGVTHDTHASTVKVNQPSFDKIGQTIEILVVGRRRTLKKGDFFQLVSNLSCAVKRGFVETCKKWTFVVNYIV